MFFLCSFLAAASASVRQTFYRSERSQNKTIEVGPGNLKLNYSGNEGKLTNYANVRNSVCYFVCTSFISNL